jgi:predicted MFS family arabinose efflux permease
MGGAPGHRSVGVAAAGFTTFINLYSTQALLPTLARSFGTSLAQTGLTVTASLVAVAMVAPFVGGISDMLGRKRLILGAAVLLVLPTLAAAWAPTLEMLVVCRFLQGLLLPFIFAVTIAYVAEECEGAEGVRATGVYAVGTIIGGFAGRFIAGWTADYLDWRAAFLVLAGITALGALTIGLCLPGEQRFRAVSGWRGSLSGLRGHFGNRQVMATCAVGFAVLFSIVACFTYANVLLAAPPYHFGPAQLGSVFVVYLLGAVATPVASRVTLRLGRSRTMWLGVGIACTGLLLTLSHSLAAIVAGLALVAMGVFTEQVLSIGHVAVAARGARSTAVGLYVTSYYVGGSLGGIVPAGIWAHLGWPGCVALVLLVQMAALAITWVVWPRQTGLP